MLRIIAQSKAKSLHIVRAILRHFTAFLFLHYVDIVQTGKRDYRPVFVAIRAFPARFPALLKEKTQSAGEKTDQSLFHLIGIIIFRFFRINR